MAGDDEQPVPKPTMDFTNPFYIGPHDVPSAKISNVILRRDNWEDWKNSMTFSLKSRRKFGFVNGMIPKPTDAFGLDNWEVFQCTLVQWIRNTIDPSLLDTISYPDNVSVLWTELESQFAVVDGTKIHGLKTQLHKCKQTKGMDVSTYYRKMKALWDSIVVHEPPFACKCGHCECGIGLAARKRLDNESLHQFFMGLDATLYANLRSQLLQLDPLPTLNRAYHAVLQEERLRAPVETAPDVSDVLAFATPTPAPSTVDWRALRDKERGECRQLFCSSCETRGHDTHHCFIKTNHFPEWWGDRPRNIADYRCYKADGRNNGGSKTGHSGSGGSNNATSRGSLPDRSLRKTIGVGELRDGLYWISAEHHLKTYFVSRDAVFHEHIFPYTPDLPPAFTSDLPPSTTPFNDDIDTPTVNNDPPDTLVPSDEDDESDGTEVGVSGNTDEDVSTAETTTTTTTGVATERGPTNENILGRGHRIKIPNSRLRGYVLDTAQSPSPQSSSPTSPSSPSGTPFSLTNYVNCNKFSEKQRHFLAAITAGVEPPSFKEAFQDEAWCAAMRDEINALERNNTWKLTDLPPNKKALGCRCVCRIKYKSDGSIETYKARLVVFGNHQIEGLDYQETFAPVVKMAPRCWFPKLAAAIRDYGFLQSYSDYSLFSYSGGAVRLFVLIYVGDLVIAGNDSSAIATFKTYLGNCFHMKDLGQLKYFLGLEVSRSSEGIYLSQRKYALDIISETGLLGAKSCATPLEQHHKLGVAKGAVLEDAEPYRRLVGRLVYLAITRPDITYSVHVLSQYLHQPRKEHMAVALRIVRYLKGSPGQGIFLRSDSQFLIDGWCDSDWGGCPLSRRSATGWIVLLDGSPISWKTKKQATVSLSSTEAEYRFMAALVCELKWLKGLLSSLGVSLSLPMRLFCDNQSALHLAHNPVFHERTKHIEIDCHFVRDAISESLVSTAHVSTHEQPADIFTKALGAPQFYYLLRKLDILDLHAPT
ncbi:uncharacterized protein LOC141640711 [Silene latifolia]|uniref:uncharacterized protein LOC141640711 n=1 Tax=Silene latifolia TaxID=37657 RepID=UPI003D76AF97